MPGNSPLGGACSLTLGVTARIQVVLADGVDVSHTTRQRFNVRGNSHARAGRRTELHPAMFRVSSLINHDDLNSVRTAIEEMNGTTPAVLTWHESGVQQVLKAAQLEGALSINTDTGQADFELIGDEVITR